MKRLLTVFVALCLIPSAGFPAAAQDEARQDYYDSLARLHRTAFILRYVLEPDHFMELCETVHGADTIALGSVDESTLAADIRKATAPIHAHIAEQEGSAELALINNLYLRNHPEKGLDFQRFFQVYHKKARRSRALIDADLQPKTELFVRFLKLNKIPGREYCQNKLQSDKIEDLKANWPQDAQELREELDDMLSGTALPQDYRETYRRLLQ